MIVIKTDLKEMPKGCFECTHEDVSDNGFYFCKAVNRLDAKTVKYEKCRPEWCPLIEIKESNNNLAEFIKKLKAQPRDFVHSYQLGCIVLSDEQIEKLISEVKE